LIAEPDSDSEPNRIVHGGSQAGMRALPMPTDEPSFEAALETVRVASYRSFSGEEIRALGIVMRMAMVKAAERGRP